MSDPARIAVLTISDGVAAGTRTDASGDAVQQWITHRGAVVAARDAVPDDVGAIVRALLAVTDAGTADVILTTGGTGLTARDVTPEATRVIVQRRSEERRVGKECRARRRRVH